MRKRGDHPRFERWLDLVEYIETEASRRAQEVLKHQEDETRLRIQQVAQLQLE